jgi:phage regulator Rha-like protein
MIARFVKHFNELKEDFQADSRSKRKKLEKHKAEAEVEHSQNHSIEGQ